MRKQTSRSETVNDPIQLIDGEATPVPLGPVRPEDAGIDGENGSTIEMVEEFFSGKRDSFEGQVPPQLGNYLLGEPIGRGAMGVVFRATQMGLTRPVAIKVLRQDALWIEERFEREARLASRLYHPNIVPVLTTAKQRTAFCFWQCRSFRDGVLTG